MNGEQHLNGAVSALVMLAAVAGTWTVYSAYQDNQVVAQYEEAESSLSQTASALVSLRTTKATSIVVEATSTATTTEKAD